MSWSVLKRDALETFNRATTLDAIERNLDDLDNDFQYLFPIILFPVYNVD